MWRSECTFQLNGGRTCSLVSSCFAGLYCHSFFHCFGLFHGLYRVQSLFRSSSGAGVITLSISDRFTCYLAVYVGHSLSRLSRYPSQGVVLLWLLTASSMVDYGMSNSQISWYVEFTTKLPSMSFVAAAVRSLDHFQVRLYFCTVHPSYVNFSVIWYVWYVRIVCMCTW